MRYLHAALRKFKKPFGLSDCEAELEILRDGYQQFYFHESPFSKAALKENTYLIVGRRGSGKTALSQYFSFQREVKNPICIEVANPQVYQQVLTTLAERTASSQVIAIPHLARVWEYVIWSTVFHELRDQNLGLSAPCDIPVDRAANVSEVIRTLFESLTGLFETDNELSIGKSIDTMMNDTQLKERIRSVKRFAHDHPIFIAIDTLEQYDVRDEHLMTAMSALVQFAAQFNLQYADDRIHLKVFMSGEAFPRLKAAALLNPLKHSRDPLYLLWRPKELLRLIGWRFWRFLLEADPEHYGDLTNVRWTSHKEVIERLWEPFFGRELVNSNGLQERTFAYILRHTQMRPRQLIYICNEIASAALESEQFPNFPPELLRAGLKKAESELATEIVNSYRLTYPNVDRIIDALMGMPKVFIGTDLDKRARETKSEWRRDAYSLSNFRQLVTELGIVGRVSKKNEEAGFIDADFEYSSTERITIMPRDECVIHPMFYARLNVQLDQKVRVMPFSVERGEVAELQGLW